MLLPMSAGWPDGRKGTPDPDGGPTPSKESQRGAKAIVAAVVLVLLIVFVIRNSQRVNVDFIITKGHFRLIWVIVICSFLGAIVGFLLGRPVRTKRQRSGRPPRGSRGGSGDGDLPTA
jgi:uncharacterized integral membrane protein